MSWTDKELDELFKDAAAGQSFEYNAAYFKDIEAQLPVNKSKKRGFIWFWGSAGLILIVLSSLLFVNKSKKSEVHLADRTPERVENTFELTNSEKNISGLENRRDDNEMQNVFSGNAINSEDSKVQNDQIETTELNVKTFNSTVKNEFAVIDQEGMASESLHLLEIGTLAITNIQLSDPLSPELVDQAFTMPLLNRSQSKLYVEFAGGIGQSPISSSENGSTKSFNWSLGGGYIYSRNKWSVSAGVGVGELYFDNLYIKERSMIYGFGVNTFDNQYEFTSMFKLDLPVSFSYRFGSHELNAGLNTSIPLFTRVSYVELKDGLENINGKSMSTTTPYFRRMFFEPSIGYRFELDNNWSIGANLKAQLINPLGSDRIKGDRNNMPLSGQITLRRIFELR